MQKRPIAKLALGVFLLLTLLASGVFRNVLADVNITVSIKPVHSLISAVTEGVTEPRLLLTGFESPHHYSLRPSDRKTLADSDLVFRVDPLLEGFLNKPVKSLSGKTRVITLTDIDELRKIPYPEDDDHEHHGEHDHGSIDPHVWLDIDNAIELVKTTQNIIAAADPANENAYAANASKTIRRLQTLKQELLESTRPLQEKPFIVFHNAYGYLHETLNIKPVAAIQTTEDRAPGAKRTKKLLDLVKSENVICVFAEPDSNQRTVNAIANSTGIRQGVLDIIGVELAPGPEAYFDMMRNLINALNKCLL